MEKSLLSNPLTDKNTSHSYLSYYSDLVNKDIEDMLEIGTTLFGGGSIIMFHEYFKKANIHSIDITDAPEIWKSYDRITHYKMDAYNINYFMKLMNNRYDFILDDGSHRLEDQIFSAIYYIDLLKENGILIIEDIQNINNCEKIINSVDKSKYKKYEIFDLRKNKNRVDDIFIVFFK